ncbi:MAG: DUF2155 domain-containing protein [Alphaproteobacteria bacterium]|nr:DUF2155 domain-containing protein [Alphaproteobacteria bacterium]
MKNNKTQQIKFTKHNVLTCFFAVFFVLFAVASVATSSDEFIENQIAVVRVLHKPSVRVSVHEIPVGRDFAFSRLGMTVRACMTTQPFMAEDHFMFIEIARANNRIFSGWMTASAPGDNPLQDSEYDVWLVECR